MDLGQIHLGHRGRDTDSAQNYRRCRSVLNTGLLEEMRCRYRQPEGGRRTGGGHLAIARRGLLPGLVRLDLGVIETHADPRAMDPLSLAATVHRLAEAREQQEKLGQVGDLAHGLYFRFGVRDID